MTKTRTTIILPTALLKKAKYKAVENNTNLSKLIETALNLILFKAQNQYLIEKEKKEKLKNDLSLINKLAGGFRLGKNLTPVKIKKIILNRYDEEMLS